jgi:HAMP domain-containing protein/signal transduction histidine kinase/CheY-like chemotaxis protein
MASHNAFENGSTPSARARAPRAEARPLAQKELLAALRALRRGEFSVRLPEDRTGTDAQICEAFNEVAQTAESLRDDVAEVRRLVGDEGRTKRRLSRTYRGGWGDYGNAVNGLIGQLSSHGNEVARVVEAVARGDFSQAIDLEGEEAPLRGDFLRSARTVNEMVKQLSSLTTEVTRVAREVGIEGKLGAQAQVQGVSGGWRELTDSVNLMASNLTTQVREIARVTTAVAQGDLTKTINIEVRGEIEHLKHTINTMVGQLSAFADEVTRVAREVGTEGVLGGQAQVRGVSGVWRELTENVNSMARNLTDQVRNVAEVVTAIARGDLSHKISVDARGEILTLKNTINATVDKLNSFGAEVTRVARLVGTEGTLGVQAEVNDVSGIWKELTDNVNLMGRNLTDQVRDIAAVTTAVANGDLSKKITVEVRGELLDLKNTVNTMVVQLSSFADEVTRVAREVGTAGVLGGQAQVRGVSGIWKELTDNVNSMASNLTNQVRNIADVASAVARGDLGRKITVDARGEVQDLKTTLNDMVDQLNAFSAEVTRVAREVGVEGKLGGQASVEGVRGVWKELTGNVNLMASNLTNQVRDIAAVTTAVARGDLTKKIMVDARGEILELKSTINIMVDQLSAFADEVTRLASDVGIQGKLGGQADVRGVSGTWRDLTDNVNSMATNLTDQVRNISQVATAIAQGQLDKKIVVDARGEILELKNTINTMVDQLSSFAEQVTRVAREVGTEGKLGGQASVDGVRGIWKELTDNVNQMGSNLTNQVRDISQVSTSIARGDLGRKVTVEVRGELLDLKNTINTMVDQLSSFADEVTRVARDVGVEGKLGGQAEVRGVSGIWKELTDNVNLMASNLTSQVRDIARVTTAVANGDLSRTITVEVRGEILELKNTINTMVDQLSSFADEVTRVAREVGTEGILGGQAEVRGLSGTWRELTDNVNVMARNLTEQVRGIARVVTAVANGDLKRQLTLEARGEIATLVETINAMTVTLSTFADQVTSVARDVGVEGRLGGQADVPGAAGMWRDLTNNVNELAGNLTRQVRAIGDVATAVTKGDLSQSITVEAKGEVALLKDNLNQMIRALAETTRLNKDQDWLKTNLTRFTRMLQGQRDLLTVANQVLSELAPVVDAQHGALFTADKIDDETRLRLFASYAYKRRKEIANEFVFGEGLVGQAALERKRIVVTEVPPGYIELTSALGKAPPLSIVVAPILFEGEVKGVIELASFHHFTEVQLDFLDQLLESLGIVFATIAAAMRTDELLRQSQGLAEELQEQQDELQTTNEELEEKATQLTVQKNEVERKNREVEIAKQELEEKAEQLALTSRYKSQFLANMSHELRTPLNSLLILSRKLAENRDGNLSGKQVEYASTIHQSGSDLLVLINEILDLAKIESGTMTIEPTEILLTDLRDHVQGLFAQVAEERRLEFSVELARELPASLVSDGTRLKQVLRNLLSNAFKFTERGRVTVRMFEARPSEWSMDCESLNRSRRVIGFSVIDTGIGIPKDKQKIVFEAFQQVDGGTSRRYGGTGLGLAISREIAGLLGGELSLTSEVGVGSTFTLFLPEYAPQQRGTDAGTNAPETSRAHRTETFTPAAPWIADDRQGIAPSDRVLLIVEDDQPFARTLLGVAREGGFRGVVALNAASGLELARTLRPHVISLDLGLPDMDGWVLLDQLKHDPVTRHIPVQIISASDQTRRGLEFGAIDFLTKPVGQQAIVDGLERIQRFLERGTKHLLVVSDDAGQHEAVVKLIGNGDVSTATAPSPEEATALLGREEVDCMIVWLSRPEPLNLKWVRSLRNDTAHRAPPVVVFAGRSLRAEEESEIEMTARVMVVKTVRSLERLLDVVTLFLHRAEERLPPESRQLLRQASLSRAPLAGKKILVVDDDIRNIFAITAVLEEHEVKVVYAENGRDALAVLEREGDVDLVLMDIMMPEMDGYEATRHLRREVKWARLPVIALTAKAMGGDREKCIQAGASDYITKPVDSDQLHSLLRVWLQG